MARLAALSYQITVRHSSALVFPAMAVYPFGRNLRPNADYPNALPPAKVLSCSLGGSDLEL